MEKIGVLGVAVWDCIVSGVCPSVLVGRDDFGAPSSYRVKAVASLVTSHIRKVVGGRYIL